MFSDLFEITDYLIRGGLELLREFRDELCLWKNASEAGGRILAIQHFGRD